MGYIVECYTTDQCYYLFFSTEEEAKLCEDIAKDYFDNDLKYVKIILKKEN